MNSNDYLNINLTGSKKNVTFVFREQSISPSDKEMKKNVNLYTNYTLKKQFIDFLLSNPTFSRYREASFYLNRNNTITKLNPEKTVSRLGIGNFDTIIISFYEPNDERNQEQQGDNSDRININRQITQAEITKEPLTLTRKKNWKKYLIIGSIILIISIFLIVYFLWPSPPKSPIFTKESSGICGNCIIKSGRNRLLWCLFQTNTRYRAPPAAAPQSLPLEGKVADGVSRKPDDG